MNILLVDDDEDCRRIYRIALEHAGHSVLTAKDGAEGVRLAAVEKPDVILLDLAMPVLDGYMALNQLRSSPATRALPVIALTAHAGKDDADELREAGFDALLAKPVSPSEVVAAVQKLKVRGGTEAG